MFKGGVKKIAMFAIVAIANICDSIMNVGVTLRDAAILFFIANEALSVVENCAAMGLPIPPKFRETLGNLKNKVDNIKPDDVKQEQKEGLTQMEQERIAMTPEEIEELTYERGGDENGYDSIHKQPTGDA